ncbi:MAG TPA: hypothetical protein DIU00_15005 [Phycisphaerales bacterium]|nr:hypothetical protein [Phycisphaerales bacterium]
MYKKHFVTKIILLSIVIVMYGIVTSAAPAVAVSTEQSPKTLHEAAKSGKIADVKSFISKCADVNAKDASGRTALHYAARNGHKEIVEVLLEHGVDVNVGEKYYNGTAAEGAMGQNHKEIVELLISKGADVSALNFALYIKDEAQARSLIEGGADVNKQTPYGTTPLHRAVGAGLKKIVELLIDKGADVNAKDNWSWTPLHSAAYGRKEMVELMIAKGADVNAKDGAGRTPLHYAMQRGHREIAELLLSEQIRPLSGDLARIALARKRLQQSTNHAAPFEKKLLDIEELLIHLTVKDILPVLEWEKLKGLKIKEILNVLDEQNKAYFEANPESQYDGTEMMILSLLKNAINEFLDKN